MNVWLTEANRQVRVVQGILFQEGGNQHNSLGDGKKVPVLYLFVANTITAHTYKANT